MRALVTVVLVFTSFQVSFAGDLGRMLIGAAVAQISESRGSYSPAPEPMPAPMAPAEVRYRLEWAEEGVLDASSCQRYGDGWRRYGTDRECMKSAIAVAGQRQGLLLLAPDTQARAIQARSSRPGYDPRTAPTQGLWRAPQGILSATITFSGYACREELSLGRRSGARWMKEEYRVAVDLVVSSVETLKPVSSARTEGSSSARFLKGDLRIEGVNVGGLVSRRARPDQAIAAAAQAAMSQLADQLLNRPNLGSSELVVAEVNGAEVVIMTTDSSDVRDAGVVEGFKYALRGAGVVNPVTGQPSRGTREIGAVEIHSIDADVAQGSLFPDSQIPAVGDKVTLVPYQSLHE